MSSEVKDEVKDATLPPLTTTPDFLPVYTVFLRRSNVMSGQERPTIRSPQDGATVVGEFLKETDREHIVTLSIL